MIVAFHPALQRWGRLSLTNNHFSHLSLIPLISIFLICLDRKDIFRRAEYRLDGLLLVAMGVVLYAGAYWHLALSHAGDDLTWGVLAIVLIWAGVFRSYYGRYAWHTARFPIRFLLFMVPLPTVVLEQTIRGLQLGSAAVVESMFRLLRVPYLRGGMDFELPGITIRVGEQCSGIRSSVALLIVIVLAAHLFLRSGKKKALLYASVVPLVLFKNGLRIVTLSLLAVYVNPGVLNGWLHTSGGVLFFTLMLVAVGVLCIQLSRSERTSG